MHEEKGCNFSWVYKRDQGAKSQGEIKAAVVSVLQTCIDSLCQGYQSGFGYCCGEGGPGNWSQPSSFQPLLQYGEVNFVCIQHVLSLEGSHSGSAVIQEEEGPQHGVASADLSWDIEGHGLSWEADQLRESGRGICGGKEGYESIQESC